jgi:hypothetical protein
MTARGGRCLGRLDMTVGACAAGTYRHSEPVEEPHSDPGSAPAKGQRSSSSVANGLEITFMLTESLD